MLGLISSLVTYVENFIGKLTVLHYPLFSMNSVIVYWVYSKNLSYLKCGTSWCTKRKTFKTHYALSS